MTSQGDPQPSHVGIIKINPPTKPEFYKPKPIVISPLYIKPKKRDNRSKVIRERARKLVYTHSYPFAPVSFYSPPDKGTETPFNLINYGSTVPEVSDTSIKENKRKSEVKQQMIKYQNSAIKFQSMNDEIEQIEGNLVNVMNKINKGFLSLDTKVSLLRNTQYTI